MARDTQGRWIGPCPIAEFMNDFLRVGRNFYQPKKNPRRLSEVPFKGLEASMHNEVVCNICYDSQMKSESILLKGKSFAIDCSGTSERDAWSYARTAISKYK